MGTTYADAGVNQDRKDSAIDVMLRMMRKTYDPGVIEIPWGFAGLYSLKSSPLFDRPMKDPVLVACADGVGTKVKLAQQMDIYDTVGIDLVAMCVNDLVCTGGKPLFFLDYMGLGDADPERVLALVKGVIEGCKQGQCALLGGETAEMPGVYKPKDYDLAGQIVPLNTWTHLAFVMNATNDVTFYVDGVNVGTITGTNPSNAPNANWVIGAFRTVVAPPECFDGSIDDIQVYSGSLSDAEVATLFAAPGSTLDGGTTFCAGDGSGTPCPCGNAGSSDSGCANSSGGGASIGTQGVASITGQSFVLTATGLPSNQFGVFFQGNNALNNGLGVPFGDGLRCVGGAARRLQIVNSDFTGAAQTTVDVAAQGGVVAGDLRRYQLWFTDPGSICGALFNLSNATELTWQA